jgi:restriction endonuclease S subunit
LDAQFYRPQFLERKRILHNAGYKLYRLGSLAEKIDVGHVGPMTTEYREDGVLLLRSQNIKEFQIDTDKNPIFISKAFHDKLSKSQVNAGDILITRSGVAGNVAIVPKHFPTANSADIILIRLKRIVDPLYVVAFLNSSFGRFQVDRQVSGGLQGHLNLTIAEDILVPELPKKLQEGIAGSIRTALNRLAEAKSIYTQARHILENELGIDRIDLSHEIGTTACLSNLFTAGRWDSEFYKPKYKRVMEALSKARKVSIENLHPLGRVVAYLTNGHTPLHHDLTLGEVLFLTAEHVYDFRVDFQTDKRILQQHHETELSRTVLKSGDILVTIKGKVGNCAVVNHCPSMVNINQDVALIRLRDGIHPYFFAAWFNSLIGKQIVEQRSTGGINPFLGLGNLRGMPFPIISHNQHQRIGNLIQQTVEKAQKTEQEASNLLEEAKSQIEQLIEGRTNNGLLR